MEASSGACLCHQIWSFKSAYLLLWFRRLGKAEKTADMVGGVQSRTREEKSYILSSMVPFCGKNLEVYRKKVT